MTNFAKVLRVMIIVALTGFGGGGGGTKGPKSDACSSLGLGRIARFVDGTVCTGLANSPVVRVITAVSGELGLCTGTMITSQIVLTAAYCVVGTVGGGVV